MPKIWTSAIHQDYRESLICLHQLFVMKVNSHRMLSTRQSNTHNLIVKRIIYNCWILVREYTTILILKLEMSSTSFITTLIFVTRQINIFAGISIFIGGVIGNLLTIIVFLSLHTLRQRAVKDPENVHFT